MNLLSFERLNTAQTAAVTLMTVAALALLALVAAYWTWEWLAPHPGLRGQPSANGIGHAESAYALFGNAERDHNNALPSGVEIRLLGIVAATKSRSGYAVVRIEPRVILTVREGEDIAPGLRLAEVDTDQVILERGGTRETLGWPAKSTSAEPPALRLGK
jgi:general secretion pathway protein C